MSATHQQYVLARRYPRHGSAKLAGVKEGLYHPNLPTLRRMDRDDAMSKLPYEHSRTTTACSKGDFASMRSSLRTEGGPAIQCKHDMFNKDVLEVMVKYKPETSRHTDNWNQILNRLNERPKQTETWHNKLSALGSDSVGGLFLRKKQPDITSSWQLRRSTVCEGTSGPSNWNNGAARPLPATLYSRYRGFSISSEPWK